MAIREILVYPNEELKRVSEPVEVFDEELKQLVEDMFDTLHANGGIGLAAPQIGVHKQVVVMDLTPILSEEDEYSGVKKLVLINPVLTGTSNQTMTFEEGCLSIPQRFEKVVRWKHIQIKGVNENNEPLELSFVGLPAVVVQHELDHLVGRTMLDRVSFFRKLALKAEELAK